MSRPGIMVPVCKSDTDYDIGLLKKDKFIGRNKRVVLGRDVCGFEGIM